MTRQTQERQTGKQKETDRQAKRNKQTQDWFRLIRAGLTDMKDTIIAQNKKMQRDKQKIEGIGDRGQEGRQKNKQTD